MATGRSSIEIDPALESRLQAEAEHADRSLADVAGQAIGAFLDKQEAKREAIRQAAAEAREGRFVEEAAAHAWIESWDSDAELPMPTPSVSIEERR